MTQENKKLKPSEIAFDRFKEEAELFFVKKFITSNSIQSKYSFCLDVFFELDNNPEIEYGRGIIMYSPHYGQGKSFFFDVIEHRCRRIENRNIFKRTTAKDLVTYCIENGEDALKDFIKVKNLYIDDIGDEGDNKNFQIKKSKNMINVLRFVLLYRYEMWVKHGWKTYGTTNLNIDELARCYDGRLSDRIKQMVHWVDVEFLKNGKSFRQYEGTRKLTQNEIALNYKKIAPKEKEPEAPDTTKYLNDLINESHEYINRMGWVDWKLVKTLLIDRKLLDYTDFMFTDNQLEHAEFVLKHDIVDTVKFLLRDTDREVRLAERQRRLADVGDKEITDMAATIVAKQKFIELRDNEHKF